jgi:hypothetical protein
MAMLPVGYPARVVVATLDVNVGQVAGTVPWTLIAVA